jgi:hypothetical protein
MQKKEIVAAIEGYCRKKGLQAWKPRAALIDMDGTLIDSMRSHTAAWKRLSDELGLDAERDEFYLFEGMTGRATIKLLYKRAKGFEPTDAECDELYKRKTRYFNELPRLPVLSSCRIWIGWMMTFPVHSPMTCASLPPMSATASPIPSHICAECNLARFLLQNLL